MMAEANAGLAMLVSDLASHSNGVAVIAPMTMHVAVASIAVTAYQLS